MTHEESQDVTSMSGDLTFSQHNTATATSCNIMISWILETFTTRETIDDGTDKGTDALPTRLLLSANFALQGTGNYWVRNCTKIFHSPH